jgi:hypothetical protein
MFSEKSNQTPENVQDREISEKKNQTPVRGQDAKISDTCGKDFYWSPTRRSLVGDQKSFPWLYEIFIPPLLEEGGGYTVLPLSVCLSFHPSKIFFGTFFSATVGSRNLIFGHKRHIGIPYCG